MNPLLNVLSLPPFSMITTEAIGPALDEALSAHRSSVAAIVRSRSPSFAEAWLPLEQAETRLQALWSAVSHLHAVASTPELRSAFAIAQERIVENSMEVGQNRDLYEVLIALSKDPEFEKESGENRVAVERAIRDFRLSGVGLEPEERERFRAISIEISALSTAFGNAVLEATNAWSEHVTDASLLAGISDPDLAMFAEAAQARELDGWVITLQQPSVNAIMTFAEDRELRARVYEAAGTRASNRGPHAGQFDNSERIARLLELRQEAAELLGFNDSVERSLVTKMASNSDEVLAFLRDIAQRARPAAEQEFEQLRRFAASKLGLTELQPWDLRFASNRLSRELYAFDEQAVRPYFPIERVLAGWQTLLLRLFDIRLLPRVDVDLYAPDVRFYDVADGSGKVFAGIYVDLHTRDGKRSGAWVARSRPRIGAGDGSRMPVAYLVCNSAPVGSDVPPLLSHGDIVTLLHETGHALHEMCTEVSRPSIAGTHGFEWDAVELPSQLMEDFAWDRAVLTEMSGHYLTGEQLPSDLYARMLEARSFQSGLVILRQVEFALFDLEIHLGTLCSDPMQVLETVRDEVAVVRPPEWHRFPHSFSHIFAGGYASGYYSYLWAEVLAADAFQAFAEAGIVNRTIGDRLRTEILARGATRPARESFRAFRGRDADPKVMLERHGLSEELFAG